jgi:hypothetical protein
MKRRVIGPLLLLLKLAVTGALLLWLSSRMDVAAVAGGLRKIELSTAVFAIGLHVLAFLVMGVRWWMLLRHADPRVPLLRVFPSYYLGVFLNLVLPTGTGGDVARTVHLSWHGLGLRGLVSSMIVDKAVGLTTMLLMGAVSALLISGVHLDAEIKRYCVIVIAIIVTVAALLFSPFPDRIVRNFRGRTVLPRPVAVVLRIAHSCYSYRSRPGLLAAAVALSLAGQSLVILVYYVLGQALGLGVPVFVYFAIVPIVFLSAVLPSLGGLGVREGVLVGLLLALPVEGQAAITLSLAYLGVLWLSSLPGVVVTFKNRPHAAAKALDAR